MLYTAAVALRTTARTLDVKSDVHQILLYLSPTVCLYIRKRVPFTGSFIDCEVFTRGSRR